MERRWDLGRVVGWASAHQSSQTNSSNPANSTASRVFGKPSGFGGFGFRRGLAEWLVWVGGNGWIGGGGWIGGLKPTLHIHPTHLRLTLRPARLICPASVLRILAAAGALPSPIQRVNAFFNVFEEGRITPFLHTRRIPVFHGVEINIIPVVV
ncbi:Uncharacterised protein [Neisseria meningitidis]|nr:Uncharacterised protein [Neisseria meningitidis]